MINTDSYASIHEQYVAAIDWMRSLGVSLQSGRTIHYEKVLRHWKDEYRTASDEDGREVFPDFVSSMFEIFEFVRIHRAFRDVAPSDLGSIIEKLRKGVNGPISAIDETPDSTAARNFLFEADVAARAHRPGHGVETILDARSDTGIRIDRKKLWVECKRVTRVEKLEHNLRKACSQLEQLLSSEVGSGHRGIVAVDITKIINPGDKLFVSRNDRELIESAQRMLDGFIEEHAQMWQRVYAVKHRKIVGTIFRLSFMATSEARNLLVQTTQWGLSPRADASAADVRIQEQLVAALDTSD